jgi:hypothetical protein
MPATGIAAITALEVISLRKDQIRTLVIIILARRGFRRERSLARFQSRTA